MNTRCAPDRICLLHLCNELPDFSGQTRLSGLASALPTFAAPLAPESVAMPAHDGLGLDDDHSRTPIHPTARQPNQDHAIALAQTRPFSLRLYAASCRRSAKFSRIRLRRLGKAKLNSRRSEEICAITVTRVRELRTPLSSGNAHKLLNLNRYVVLANHRWRGCSAGRWRRRREARRQGDSLAAVYVKHC